jgi:hypothetical protein
VVYLDEKFAIESEKDQDVIYLTIDLLRDFVTQHKYRIKYVILNGTISLDIMKLLKCTQKRLNLGNWDLKTLFSGDTIPKDLCRTPR